MNLNINMNKKDDIINEEEPKPEEFIIPSKKKIIQRNKKNLSHSQSNIYKKNNSINSEFNTSKFETFNIQQQYYDLHRQFLYLNSDKNYSFIQRMEFDAYRRHIKEKEIKKYIENNKIKIQEEERQKTFMRLNNDAKRRHNASSNMEKMDVILKNEIFEEPIKKYSDEEWKKIYEERFDNYMQKLLNKKENMKKQLMNNKQDKENYEINLCTVKKASMKHILKESNRMYVEAMRQKVKKEEKILRLSNNKYNIEDEYENDPKKYMKKIKEQKYNFINENENENVNLKRKNNIDIKNYNYEISKKMKNMEESQNYKFDNKNNERNLMINYNKNNDKKIKMNKQSSSSNKNKKIIFNFFEEEKEKKDINDIDDKYNNNKENILQNDSNFKKIDLNINNNNYIEKNIKRYYKTANYIINQFFLRNQNN